MIKKSFYTLGLSLAVFSSSVLADGPILLDDQFQIPKGFHIYKAASSSLTGGSYVLCFDGVGDLLVGTGKTIRRLTDDDSDGVYDSATELVDGLGPRGPQGILVHGETLYAVGGDGVQYYTGYPDQLVHQGRLGEPFHTGGDHAAHTLLRGHDDWIYFVTGDGGGARDRLHITEETSPILRERNASVFRFNLSGTRWECVSTGGRNPPSLGMNYLGELFSLDSDMEWHVAVPWYRPVRLNHWGVGADLGWQGVGAYPPYYIDTISGVADVGRGSPTWGTFYEHEQLPDRYQDAFMVCDYRWKSASQGNYDSSGRLLSFALTRSGASWRTGTETLAMPKPGAVDSRGKPIDFALVDVTVAPDGSLFMSDHNQGIWRLFYGSPSDRKATGVPPVLPAIVNIQGTRAEMIDAVLDLPQPQSEWTRLQIEAVKGKVGVSWPAALQHYVLDETHALRKRLRALRLISPAYRRLSGSFYVRLAESKSEVLRGQAAWLTGLQGGHYHPQILHPLLSDASPFVRRRAAEALTRVATKKSVIPLVQALEDPERRVRYTAMQALAHLPTADWFEVAIDSENAQRVMRALVAAKHRRELLESRLILNTISRLVSQAPETLEDQLDLLRVVGLFQESITNDPNTKALVSRYLIDRFPSGNEDLRWEQARLLGALRVSEAIPALLDQLESQSDGVRQFHLASALSLMEGGWDQDHTARLLQWLLERQTGWFADFSGKGMQFRSFWGTVLSRFQKTHADAFDQALAELSPNSQLGRIVMDQFVKKKGAESDLIKLFQNTSSLSGRLVLLETMVRKQAVDLQSFAREQLRHSVNNPQLKKALVGLLLAQGTDLGDASILWESFNESNDGAHLDDIASDLMALAHQHGNRRLRRALQLNENGRENRGALAPMVRRLISLPDAAGAFDQLLTLVSGQERNHPLGRPRWIWAQEDGEPEPTAYFRRTFVVDSNVEGWLRITGDNEYSAYLDGELVSEGDEWTKPALVSLRLDAGAHEVAVRVRSDDRPAGLLASVTWTTEEGRRGNRLITNVGWEATTRRPEEWPRTQSATADWKPARDLGAYGVAPWGEVFKGEEKMEAGIIRKYWVGWFESEFGETVAPADASGLSRNEIRQLLLSHSLTDGDSERGRSVYLKYQCHSCHQGVPEVPGRIFGPDLAGVTRRLTREQLADAIVAPSKDVAERYRATEVEMKNGTVISGFLTEQSVDQLVIATQTQVLTVMVSDVESIHPLQTSLMPEGLLDGSDRQEMIDLLRFLDRL